ncbi:hypothetical protein Cme02nite_55290 [Catellatospora methionotrophica]|uniref:Tellurium resistance protein n=1 Tax=Catellatospora methionotrophica TaxID=121620 RepID=A0A8J3LDG1_9ACTN|nr:Tellurium resistance [Catellatospora methionotrophica]GIG17197.1 hypothetical protein Cme02nite_55290 [Catellatospora methionotrophica]
MVDYNKRPSGAAPAAPVSLSKTSLTKSSPKVSLTKATGASGQMRINLNWNARPAGSNSGGGFLKKLLSGSDSIDLDIGCLYETVDGRKGVIQALGNSFGSLDQHPYIKLDGDDRSGAASGGENLLINLDHLDHLKRVLIFAFIYEGVPAWDKADGVVTLYPVGGAPIEIRLDESSGSRMCAIALLEAAGGGLTIGREVRYINGGQADLDRAYGWGMNWSPGRK